MFENVQKCLKMFKNVQKCSNIQNIQKCPKIYVNTHLHIFFRTDAKKIDIKIFKFRILSIKIPNYIKIMNALGKTVKKASGSKTSKPLKKKSSTEINDDVSENIDEVFNVIKKSKKINLNENNDSEYHMIPIKKLHKINQIEDTEIPVKKSKKKILIENNADVNADANVDVVENATPDGELDQSKKTIKAFLESKQFLKDHNIKISTITLDCKLHTIINLDKFAKYVVLKEDEIVSIKFGNRTDTATNRTIVFIKPKKKPSVKNFYNQVTILMKPTNNPERNYINIKVFKNGSLQMTGCKDMDDFTNVTTTLINILKTGKTINRHNKTIHVKLIKEPEKIGINDVKIRMINSNFKLDYKIDRKKLAKLLKKNHRKNTKDTEIGYVECKYEPTSGHSCVNIKYHYDETNRPSIFVFQTGAIIITGAKTLQHIIMAYHFINKILAHYHDKIRIIDLDQKEVQKEIVNFFKNKKKEAVTEV